ncbi:LuxR C-terminal-related transcriptional regulator [Fulvivirgaceae bacterium BMA12]|uniref:LuxR C-terminal-related transcriptional regulator n=1 Tax=Agaribacillus aureus TaxID=3051825 RepID=A0ABT8LAR6_9BACT|nr:LuxR C-terminal-related transcriptional regulator [Fulvivirgaceae bacterium BMA12]
MDDKEYFSHLYEIASHLNKEFSLHSALRKSLEKTVELLNLETGWIWLVQGDVRSVYLAASYNLPPALSNHPERLSGWCFCIKKYLSNDIEKASNISEILCTRLKDIKSGTMDLKFHATIPITANGQKVGLLNLLSKETQRLDEKQLSILNTISELIAIAIQRTRTQASYGRESQGNDHHIHEVIGRVISPRVKELQAGLNNLKSFAEKKDFSNALKSIKGSLSQVEELKHQLSLILDESADHQTEKVAEKDFHYPSLHLTARELEVLGLVKKGYTNRQIAENLFVSERTIKFHISSILSKLFANTRTEAVDIAVQRGLIGL